METKDLLDKIMTDSDTEPAPAAPEPQKDTEKPRLTAAERREAQKLYQRQYRKKQKEIKTALEQTQIKGSEILMILQDGSIQTKILKSEDDYIEVLEGFLESLKTRKYLLSFRIARESPLA